MGDEVEDCRLDRRHSHRSRRGVATSITRADVEASVMKPIRTRPNVRSRSRADVMTWNTCGRWCANPWTSAADSTPT